MNTATERLLEGIAFGDPQIYENITILPVFHDRAGPEDYLVMSEAMESNKLVVREVSESGSVPDLIVENQARTPVLLLDGEEVEGAKQNRVLNSSILVPAESKMKIPVSCTEQGRWRHTSKVFADSDVVMPMKSRARKSKSVTHSLFKKKGHVSNQGEVWQSVAQMHDQAGTSSPTGAMKDMYAGLKDRIDNGLGAFPAEENQRGLAVMIDGRVAGMDIVSRAPGYARLHEKLVKSYLVDGLINRKEEKPVENAKAEVERFLACIRECTESAHPTPGLGEDYRYTGKTVVGSALVREETTVHVAFFASEEKEDREEKFASLRGRRRFRS
jgi:hypothetical protein